MTTQFRRFLIETTDLNTGIPNRYTRTIQNLLNYKDDPILPVIMAKDGRIYPVFKNRSTARDCPIANGVILPGYKPSQENISFLPFALATVYARTRVSRKPLPDQLRHELAWRFAYCHEKLSAYWRKRIIQILHLGEYPQLLEYFIYWLQERDFFMWELPQAPTTPPEITPLEFQPGDIYVAAGAEWRRDPIHWLELKKAGVKLAFVIYDVEPLFCPPLVSFSERRRFAAYIAAVAETADIIATPNDFTQARLEAYLSEKSLPHPKIIKVDLTGGALSHQLGILTPRLKAHKLHERPFILCSASLKARDHILWLFEVYLELAKDNPLVPVLVIAGRDNDNISKAILYNHPTFGNNVIHLCGPNDQELAWLLSHARLCLQPAFESGMGLAMTEAINFGRTCIAADAPALVSASGGCAIHLPRNEQAWKQAIIEALEKTDNKLPEIIPSQKKMILSVLIEALK